MNSSKKVRISRNPKVNEEFFPKVEPIGLDDLVDLINEELTESIKIDDPRLTNEFLQELVDNLYVPGNLEILEVPRHWKDKIKEEFKFSRAQFNNRIWDLLKSMETPTQIENVDWWMKKVKNDEEIEIFKFELRPTNQRTSISDLPPDPLMTVTIQYFESPE